MILNFEHSSASSHKYINANDVMENLRPRRCPNNEIKHIADLLGFLSGINSAIDFLDKTSQNMKACVAAHASTICSEK